MLLNFILGIYLLIGVLFSIFYFKSMSEIIDEYEKGDEISDWKRETLNKLDTDIKKIGGRNYVVMYTVVSMLIWPVTALDMGKAVINYYRNK